MKNLALLVVLLLTGAGSLAAQTTITEGFGPRYKDAQERAAVHGARGERLLAKALRRDDGAARARLLERARQELERSLALSPTFDAYVAFGRLALAQGKASEAWSHCGTALRLRPDDAKALACVDEARRARRDASTSGAEEATEEAEGDAPAANEEKAGEEKRSASEGEVDGGEQKEPDR